jgi:hypothetical protein
MHLVIFLTSLSLSVYDCGTRGSVSRSQAKAQGSESVNARKEDGGTIMKAGRRVADLLVPGTPGDSSLLQNRCFYWRWP